jgi:hypothetical protein
MCQSCIELSYFLFYNGLYIPIYTLPLRVYIILEHMHLDPISLKNLLLLELQLKIA